jgi:hypothetical protein
MCGLVEKSYAFPEKPAATVFTHSVTHSLTHSLTYLLTHSTQHSPWEANQFADSQEIPRIFGTRRFFTVLTSPRHLSLTRASSIQCTNPHPTPWRSIVILSCHLRLGLSIGLFPSGYTPKPYTSHTPIHQRYIPCPSYSRFHKPHNIGWGVKIIKLLIT